jgi:hypothetical protein
MLLSDEQVEKFAIRAARGHNGGSWDGHYTEDHKSFWRQYVRDMERDITRTLLDAAGRSVHGDNQIGFYTGADGKQHPITTLTD